MPTTQLDGLKPVANARPALSTEVLGITGLTGLKHCDELITIDCLRAIYDIPVGKTNHSGNEIGIAEWADYLYLPDLAIFFENYTSPKIPSNVHPEFISIDGGKTSVRILIGKTLRTFETSNHDAFVEDCQPGRCPSATAKIFARRRYDPSTDTSCHSVYRTPL